MRYIIETKTKKGEGIVEELLEKEKALEQIDKYDPFEKLGADVEKMGIALKKFKQSGIDWSIFTYYLRGRGISAATIEGVMHEVSEFFIKVGLLERD